ncbi:MAG: LOG family protein [Candidatus Curtissbacteria bacterium]|nr:LOG family protein [Candidatus Curtissbacteria bacterium]
MPTTDRKIQRITFLGYADAKEADDPFNAAYETAKLCAEEGYTIVNGAGPGIMKAATMGAKSVGGRTIGITFYPKDIPVFEGRDESNKVDELIVTDSYLERTLKLLEVGQVHVIFNGGTGTISEFGMAWGLARLYFGHHKPLVLYGDFWQDIIFAFTKGMYIRPEERLVFKIVNRPHKVLSAIEEFEEMIDKEMHNHDHPIFQI